MNSLKKIEIEARKKLEEIKINQEIDNYTSNLNRSRSITIGTSFGGTTEIMMRGDGGRHMWCAMQPVEVIELIYQLASNVGCNAVLSPRKDFASWRDWKVTEEEKEHLNEHPPFVSDMAQVQQLGANMNKFEGLQLKNVIDSFRAHANVETDEHGNLKNKVILKDGQQYMLGGRGGDMSEMMEAVQEIATKNTKKNYKRKEKNDSDALATQEHKDGGSSK